MNDINELVVLFEAYSRYNRSFLFINLYAFGNIQEIKMADKMGAKMRFLP